MLSSFDVSDATAATTASLGAATDSLKLTVASLLIVCFKFRRESLLIILMDLNFGRILNAGSLLTSGLISLLSSIDIMTNVKDLKTSTTGYYQCDQM